MRLLPVPLKALASNRPQTASQWSQRRHEPGANFPDESRVGIFAFMTDSDNSPAEGAIQALVWAIEEIAKTGNKKAEHHARLALKDLQGVPDERPAARSSP